MTVGTTINRGLAILRRMSSIASTTDSTSAAKSIRTLVSMAMIMIRTSRSVINRGQALLQEFPPFCLGEAIHFVPVLLNDAGPDGFLRHCRLAGFGFLHRCLTLPDSG